MVASGANFAIDQATLAPAGVLGRSRSDGLSAGQLVTLVAQNLGQVTARFRLLAAPTADTTAAASFAGGGPQPQNQWTFSPTPSVYGSYRLELIVDEGLPTQRSKILTFGIRTPNLGLRIPAWNEDADPRASFELDGPAEVAASETNEETSALYPAPGGDPRGWYPALEELILALDALGGGGGGGGALWAWNGIDVSQFAAAPLLPTFSGTPNAITGAPDLTVVAAEEGNRLRLQVIGAAVQEGVVYWPVALLEGLELPERFILRFSIIGFSNTTHYAGIVYYTNGEVALGDSHGLFALQGMAGGSGTWPACLSAGDAWFQSPMPGSTDVPVVIEIEVRGRKVVAAQPGGIVFSKANGGQTTNTVNTISYFLSDPTPYPQPFPATWDALTAAELDQLGIAVWFSPGGVPENDPYVEFGFVEVLPHPLDL